MSSRFSIIPARAIDDARLSRSALVVLCALGIYGNKGGWCRPSQSTLAKRLGVTRQAVGKGVAELVSLGYVEKRRRFAEDGSEIPCLYRILFDAELPKGADRHPENEAEALQDADFEIPPLQLPVAPPATPGVAPPATPGVAPPATPEVAPPATQLGCTNALLQRPIERPISTTTTAAAVAGGAVEISDDWQPSARCWELIEQAEVPHEFANRLVGEFVLYWAERGDKRAGWDATFLNWAKGQWAKAQEDSAKRAERTQKTPAAGRLKPGHPANQRGRDYATDHGDRGERHEAHGERRGGTAAPIVETL